MLTPALLGQCISRFIRGHPSHLQFIPHPLYQPQNLFPQTGMGRGEVSGTQRFVYQKWPNHIIPTLKFVFPPDPAIWQEWPVGRAHAASPS